MVTVGVIANPASGKDIRRLIAHGSIFDNQEKVNIVRRVVLGLEAVGVDKVVFMPDYFGIGRRAVDGIPLKIETSTLQMRIQASQDDSTLAARMMREMEVGAVVTLGGDGTNRAVAKEIGDVPIMPLSTGTNNVFPQMVEGTVAGLAAGVVARRIAPLEKTTKRELRLEIVRDGELIDIALVDVVVYDDVFIASRAVWDMTKVREIVLTKASPSNIGLSSIGGSLHCLRLNERHGVYIRLGQEKGLVDLTAPIAPGLVKTVHVENYRLLQLGDSVKVNLVPSILALDGEREVMVRQKDQMSIVLSDRGPLVIDIGKALEETAQCGLLARVNVSEAASKDCILRAIGLCRDPLKECLEG